MIQLFITYIILNINRSVNRSSSRLSDSKETKIVDKERNNSWSDLNSLQRNVLWSALLNNDEENPGTKFTLLT